MQGFPDGFEKISVEGILSQKFHGQSGQADERAENPGELAAQQQIAREPGKLHTYRHHPAAAQFYKQLQQSDVSRNSCERNHGHMRQQNTTIGGSGSMS